MLAIHHLTLPLAGLMASLVLFAASLARADCVQWQLPQKFNAIEDSGFFVVFDLSRTGAGEYRGSAHYNSGQDFREVRGRASGRVDGPRVDITVVWPSGFASYYKGTVDANGALGGLRKYTGVPEGSKEREMFWRSKQSGVCVDAPVEVITQNGPTIMRVEPPVAQGLHVDNCRIWGTDCGRAGALAFCQSRGFPMLHGFKVFDRYVGDTYVIGSKQTCSGEGCRAFSYIECERPLIPETSSAAVKNLVPCPPNCKTPASGFIKGVATQAPKPKPLKTIGKASKSATVIADVDVYDAPGGSGQVLGVIRVGDKVKVRAWPCADDWCDISGTTVPGGKGWVYSGPDYPSLQR
jgi:hypothetical protein